MRKKTTNVSCSVDLHIFAKLHRYGQGQERPLATGCLLRIPVHRRPIPLPDARAVRDLQEHPPSIHSSEKNPAQAPRVDQWTTRSVDVNNLPHFYQSSSPVAGVGTPPPLSPVAPPPAGPGRTMTDPVPPTTSGGPGGRGRARRIAQTTNVSCSVDLHIRFLQNCTAMAQGRNDPWQQDATGNRVPTSRWIPVHRRPIPVPDTRVREQHHPSIQLRKKSAPSPESRPMDMDY